MKKLNLIGLKWSVHERKNGLKNSGEKTANAAAGNSKKEQNAKTKRTDVKVKSCDTKKTVNVMESSTEEKKTENSLEYAGSTLIA